MIFGGFWNGMAGKIGGRGGVITEVEGKENRK